MQCCLVHIGFWGGGWFRWPVIRITGDDVSRWPFSPGCLVKLAAFLSSLTWPSEVVHLGAGGISYVELLILFEKWAGKDFVLRSLFRSTGGLGAQFRCQLHPCALMLIYGSCAGSSDICFRALVRLPGGLGRFLPGRIGANHGRLGHIGWETCCHWLACRPRESSGEGFLSDLLSFLGYPAGSGYALLDGS